MERFLSVLPARNQSVWLRYMGAAAIMLVCVAIHFGLQNQTGAAHLFFLLPGIFAVGFVFDRGSSIFATFIATAATYYTLAERISFSGSLLSTGLFLVTGLLVAWTAEALREQMEKFVKARESKALLLTELAHRTKNNLAIVSALLRLQARRKDVEPGFAMIEMAERIQVMAQVYDHLTLRSDRKLVDAQHYLEDIVRHLSASISGANPVAIRASADELFIHSEHAVPIAMIVNELVTNSLKYAFPDGRAGLIQVDLRAGKDIELSVSDNGIGLSEKSGESVGSRVVALLTQQLGGTLTSENLESGCRVTLRMPHPPI
jgi:two-component sensor histidine kinase